MSSNPDAPPTVPWTSTGHSVGTQDILNRAAARNPDYIYALVSGGHGSDTTLHVTHHDHPSNSMFRPH